MTVKEFYTAAELEGTFCLDLGNGEEIIISKADTALISAFGDIVIDRVILPTQPCRVCARTQVVREVTA